MNQTLAKLLEEFVSEQGDTSRTFDDSNVNFQRINEFNRIFLECQQNYLNQRLRARGHLFLNEVYDALGFERTQSGAILGWLYEDEAMGYVDFGLFSSENNAFIEDTRAEALLTFNVDGVIFDKI